MCIFTYKIKELFLITSILFLVLNFYITNQCIAASNVGISGRPDYDLIKSKVTPYFIQNKLNNTYPSNNVKHFPLQPSRDLLGDQRSFFVYNFVTNRYDVVPSTLRKVGGHCYVYVADFLWAANLITQLQIDKIASDFDNIIYPIETAYFGQENSPGIDNDVRITILVTRIYSSGNPIIGYFDPTDELPDSQAQTLGLRSNQREMFYMNGYDYIPANPIFMHTLAHEFWHMISYNQNPNEETWLEEGMADNAAYIVGYKMIQDKLEAFQKKPYIGLLSFDYHNDALAHYGASFLFVRYLFEQYGGSTEIEKQNFMRNMTRSGSKGIKTVEFALSAAGYPHIKFKDVFLDWQLTNYINHKGYAKYKYKDFVLDIAPLQVHSGYPLRERSFSLEYWGGVAIWFNYAPSSSHVVEFQGAPYGSFAPRICMFYKDGTIVVKNIPLNADNKGFFDLSEFGVKYNNAVLISSYINERGPTTFRYAVGFAGPKIGIYPNPILNDDIYITVKSTKKPEVIVKRSGGADQKVNMNFAQKDLYTGTYHVVYSGLFEVLVTGEDENGMSGTVRTTFEIRKLQNRVLNMISFDSNRGLFITKIDYDEKSKPLKEPQVIVIPLNTFNEQELTNANVSELKFLNGVKIISNITKNINSTSEVSFALDKNILPSNISKKQIGIYKVDNLTLSGYKYCNSYFKDENNIAANVNIDGEYFLMYDNVPPKIYKYRLNKSICELKVEDFGSQIESINVYDKPIDVNVKIFKDEGIIRIENLKYNDKFKIIASDHAGNLTEYMVLGNRLINNNDFINIHVSPNPANKNVTISWNGGKAPYKIKIYDVYSNLVFDADNIYNKSFNWNLLNSSFEKVANGIYYVYVEDLEQNKTKYAKIAVLK